MNIWGVEAIMGVDNIVTRVGKVTREGQGRDMMGREGKKRKEKRKEGKEKNQGAFRNVLELIKG